MQHAATSWFGQLMLLGLAGAGRQLILRKPGERLQFIKELEELSAVLGDTSVVDVGQKVDVGLSFNRIPDEGKSGERRTT